MSVQANFHGRNFFGMAWMKMVRVPKNSTRLIFCLHVLFFYQTGTDSQGCIPIFTCAQTTARVGPSTSEILAGRGKVVYTTKFMHAKPIFRYQFLPVRNLLP